jgi:Zn-dependent protease with chaperone function
MTVLWRTLLVTGAVFVLANAAWSCLAWLAWPALSSLLDRTRPATRARFAFTWRAMPTVLSVVPALAAGLAFFRFEPEMSGERTGVSLVVLAVIGASAMAFALVRLGLTVRASDQLSRSWRTGRPALTVARFGEPAWIIDSDFPVVAVLGIWKPRLVLARSVVERCTDRELAAIVAHEGAHVFAYDNLRRLWFQCAVDGLSGTRRAARAASMWQDAAEDAADDRAANAGAPAVDLASALVTVARLAPGRSVTLWPTAACFYRGAGLERRVRRLLDHNQPAPRWGRRRWVSGTCFAVAAAALAWFAASGASLGQSLYAAAEWMVQTLP